MNTLHVQGPSRRGPPSGRAPILVSDSGDLGGAAADAFALPPLAELSRQTLRAAVVELASFEDWLAPPVTTRTALRRRLAAIAGRAAHPLTAGGTHPAVWRLHEAQRARRVALAYLDHRIAVCRDLERQALERLRDDTLHAYARSQRRIATRAAVDVAVAFSESGVAVLRRSLLRDLSLASGAVLRAWQTVEQDEGPARWPRFCGSQLRLDWLDAMARLDGLLRLSPTPAPELAGLAAMLHPRLAVAREACESLQDIECLIDEVRTRMDVTPLRLLVDAPPAGFGSLSIEAADERTAMASTLRDLQVRRLDWRERLFASLDPDGLAQLHAGLLDAGPDAAQEDAKDALAVEMIDAWRRENPLRLPDGAPQQPSMAASER